MKIKRYANFALNQASLANNINKPHIFLFSNAKLDYFITYFLLRCTLVKHHKEDGALEALLRSIEQQAHNNVHRCLKTQLNYHIRR